MVAIFRTTVGRMSSIENTNIFFIWGSPCSGSGENSRERNVPARKRQEGNTSERGNVGIVRDATKNMQDSANKIWDIVIEITIESAEPSTRYDAARRANILESFR